MPIAVAARATSRIGNMNAPPPEKKPTIEYMISITGSSWTSRPRLSQLLRSGMGVSRRLPDLVVVQLPHEHVPVHGLTRVVEHSRNVERIAQRRALPGDDHEGLRRVVVSDDRHARHRLVLALVGVVADGDVGREQQQDAESEQSGHGLSYFPLLARRSAIHRAAALSPGTACA